MAEATDNVTANQTKTTLRFLYPRDFCQTSELINKAKQRLTFADFPNADFRMKYVGYMNFV